MTSRYLPTTTIQMRALLVAVCGTVSCGGGEVQPPRSALRPPASVAATAATKRAACSFGQDQTCNADPSVSALWGHCTELGTCECREGFVLSPSGYCRPGAR